MSDGGPNPLKIFARADIYNISKGIPIQLPILLKSFLKFEYRSKFLNLCNQWCKNWFRNLISFLFVFKNLTIFKFTSELMSILCDMDHIIWYRTAYISGIILFWIYVIRFMSTGLCHYIDIIEDQVFDIFSYSQFRGIICISVEQTNYSYILDFMKSMVYIGRPRWN